jgi:hypothetical protein
MNRLAANTNSAKESVRAAKSMGILSWRDMAHTHSAGCPGLPAKFEWPISINEPQRKELATHGACTT